jgi:hypothetical protein
MNLSIQLLDQDTADQARQDLAIHCQALRTTTITKAAALRQAQKLHSQISDHYFRLIAQAGFDPLEAAQAIVALEILTHCLSESTDQFFRFRDPKFSGSGDGGATTGALQAPSA